MPHCLVHTSSVADVSDGEGVSRRSLLIGAAGAAVVLGGGAGAFGYELDRHPGFRARIFGCGSTPRTPTSNYTMTTGAYASHAMRADVPWEFAMPTKHVQPRPAGKSANGSRPTKPSRPTTPSRPGSLPPLVVVLPGAGGQPRDLTTSVGLPGWATAAKLNVAFACPGGGASTYYHPRADGTNSLSWVTEEFIPMIERRFGVGGSRANRAMFGWSMGGFGSLLIAAQRPDLVCAAVGSSPAVFRSYHDAITGHPNTFDSEADWRKWGLWEHLDRLNGMPVRIDCGDADPFAATARELLRRIPNAAGEISSGCHLDSFWRTQATAQLHFLDQQFTQAVDP
jgi:S-formylglutathione hydrolase FrmB